MIKNDTSSKYEAEQVIGNQVIDWQGHSICVSYNPNYFDDVAHVEIRSKDKCPLPITETGYKSHFFMTDEPPTMDAIISTVIDWLNEEAQKKCWQEYVVKSSQLELF